MTFSIAIRTVPQRRDLFARLLAQLAPSLALPEVLGLHVSASADVYPNENACRAIDAAGSDGADWVLFLEDDAGPIYDFVGSTARWLIDVEEPHVHLYPLAHQYGAPLATWRYPVDSYYCSVAFALRATMASSLLAYVRDQPVRQGFDILSARWHKTVSTSSHLVAPGPCFVEHLGDESTLAAARTNGDRVGRLRGFVSYDYRYERNDGR